MAARAANQRSLSREVHPANRGSRPLLLIADIASIKTVAPAQQVSVTNPKALNETKARCARADLLWEGYLKKHGFVLNGRS